MGELKQKSELNLLAAELLIKEGFHAPSVHCSYYSCIQLGKHLLINNLKLKIEDLRLKYYSEKERDRVSDHSVLRKAILEELKTRVKGNKSDYTEFNKDFNSLKKHREEADYSENSITDIISDRSISTSKQLNNTITRYLK